ncbi:MAG: sulfite exporter TauE/SafE family protein [Chitinophagia bacterium]
MELSTIILLCLIAFLAGYVDAVVGGGGLIQVPSGLILMPTQAVSTIIGTLKVPSFIGTCFATYQYLQSVKIPFLSILLFTSIAFIASFSGSLLLTKMSSQFMKPVIFFVLLVMAIYTFTKKDLGQSLQKNHIKYATLKGVLICLIIGFYDGFIGPGAGSLFVLAFISILGYDFLNANAHAKIVNLSTNLGSLILFIGKGVILWPVAIPMSICNATGGFFGSRMALKKGNQFIRKIFLIVIVATLLRLGYDVFFH